MGCAQQPLDLAAGPGRLRCRRPLPRRLRAPALTAPDRPCPRSEETSNGWQRAEVIRLEQDVFTALAGRHALYVYKTDGFWSQIKSAGWVRGPGWVGVWGWDPQAGAGAA